MKLEDCSLKDCWPKVFKIFYDSRLLLQMTHVWLLSNVFMPREDALYSPSLLNIHTVHTGKMEFSGMNLQALARKQEGHFLSDINSLSKTWVSLSSCLAPCSGDILPSTRKAGEKQGKYNLVQADWLHRAVLSHFVLLGLLWSCLGTYEVLQPGGPFQTWFPFGMTHYPRFKCGNCKFLSGEQQLLWIIHYLNKPVWD